jgi:outer membrane cobalamin receptor
MTRTLTIAIVMILFPLPSAGAAAPAVVSGASDTSASPAPTAADPGASAAPQPDQPSTLNTVEVRASLDRSRDQLSPEIGASQYVFERQTIDQLPLGDAKPLAILLKRAPGVVQDSYGQLHVRGDHADLQYRINGIIIPESISGFGQTLDARVIERMQLLTGALPAQYGYRTAGIVEITTRPAPDTSGGSIGITAGSFGTFNPEFSAYGNQDRWTYFVTGNFLESEPALKTDGVAQSDPRPD